MSTANTKCGNQQTSGRVKRIAMLETALDNLAKVVPNGELLLATTPHELIQYAADELVRLRALATRGGAT